MKFTPEVKETIITLIKNGNTIKTACLAAGIGERTYYVWMEEANAENADEDKVQFLQDVKRAENEAIAFNVAQILKAAKAGAWQASAWWLERRYKTDYGRYETIEHHGQIKVIPPNDAKPGVNN